MSNKQVRSYSAGEALASAIVEMVHLMYQNKTALNFYNGLLVMLMTENERRHSKMSKRPSRDMHKIWPW